MTDTVARRMVMSAIWHLSFEPDDDATLAAIALLTHALGTL